MKHLFLRLGVVSLLCGGLAGALPASADEAGEQLFARMAATLVGGGPPLKSLRQEVSAAASVQGQEAPPTRSSIEIVLPDKLRRVISDLGVEQAVVINGLEGFMTAHGQKLPLGQSRVAEARAQLLREPFVLASFAGHSHLRVESRGTETIDETTCDVVEAFLGGTESRLCLDEAGRIVEQSYSSRHPLDHRAGRVAIRFSDYREVEGLLVPFHHVVTFEDEQLVTVTVESVQVNPDLDEALFEPPGS